MIQLDDNLIIPKNIQTDNQSPYIKKQSNLSHIKELLDIKDHSADSLVASLPFCNNDVTAGSENELLAVVKGHHEHVDLPQFIQLSNYYQNICKRARVGEMSKNVVNALENFIQDNHQNVWENSWVRLPKHTLSSYAEQTFEKDLLADKSFLNGPLRSDCDRFFTFNKGELNIRIPISYLLKLSLADIINDLPKSTICKSMGKSFLSHFLNDNTSPETFSFYPVHLKGQNKMGRGLARETSLRFLMCQLLTQYANEKFQLTKNGQTAMIYGAPLPPNRQKQLNNFISDSFYRELFMSPCLSGWNRGEEKHHYMGLCHQVLSRSQVNAISKLKEAGIIVNNLVVMPNMSNTSLANNGTHISIGSQKLTNLMMDQTSAFSPVEEKYAGDLVIKIVEHFLTLFVGTYSAAPYRMNFWDFHPEKALGFLPHELDYTHLRMLWRRWKNKASIKIKMFGTRVTPFGPEWLDRELSKRFGLYGDYIPDFRLIDYLVSLLSTDSSPALNGVLGNDDNLKADLSSMGVFDKKMSLYLFYRLRQFNTMGFSGFEGRHYSLFYSILEDMQHATNLQILLTALAYKYIIKGEVNHYSIPDNPSVESERRQIIFGQAIGIPTFYINQNTTNSFLSKIAKQINNSRASYRYKGYCRIYHQEYQNALLRIIKNDAADIIECMGFEETIQDLEARIHNRELCVEGKLLSGILNKTEALDPMKVDGDEFNQASEHYYRNELRLFQMNEAYDELIQSVQDLEQHAQVSQDIRQALHSIYPNQDMTAFIKQARSQVINEKASIQDINSLIQSMILVFHSDIKQNI